MANKKNKETVVLDELGELVRRLNEAAASLSESHARLGEAKQSDVEMSIKTARVRIEQIEAFSRTVATAVKKRIDAVREDAAKAAKLRRKGTKRN